MGAQEEAIKRLNAVLTKVSKSNMQISSLKALTSYNLLKERAMSPISVSIRQRPTEATSLDKETRLVADFRKEPRSVTTFSEKLCHVRRTAFRLLSRIGIIATFTALLMGHYGLLTGPGFSKAWFWWEGVDPHSEECTIEMPALAKELFRPPVDCNRCRRIVAVDRRSNLAPEVFEEMYAYTGRPVVVSDATLNWTASEFFSFDFFRQLYMEDHKLKEVSKQSVKGCQFFPYETEFWNLAEALNMTYERSLKPWYIGWSNCDAYAADVLRRHYQRPYFLPLNSESSRTDWIFMGTPGHGAHMHVDHVELPSWQAQIKGQKLWSLEPPPECYHECNSLQVLVNPGDIIVVDTNMWYHKTNIVSDSISITIGSEYD